jgi:hypothetical protein
MVTWPACILPTSSFAWLGNFRRLLIHWEHEFSVYRSWFTVAVLLLCLRRVCSGA